MISLETIPLSFLLNLISSYVHIHFLQLSEVVLFNNCSVLHDEHAGVGTYNRFERHRVDETESFGINAELLTHFLNLLCAGTRENVTVRGAIHHFCHFAQLRDVRFIEIIHRDERNRSFGFEDVVRYVIEVDGQYLEIMDRSLVTFLDEHRMLVHKRPLRVVLGVVLQGELTFFAFIIGVDERGLIHIGFRIVRHFHEGGDVIAYFVGTKIQRRKVGI